ncbi:MAG: hypothetical protein Q4D11_05225 [Rhodospirillales bacterium]|nr:hypothetical protein [Rhodospirillales bacterium]
MKKVFCLLAMLLLSSNAMAETVVVVNGSGTNQQIVRSEPIYYTPTYTPVQTSYYYESYNPGLSFVAGLSTAIIGGIVFDSIHHHHHKAPKHFVAPHHNPGHPGKGIGGGHHAKNSPAKPGKGGHKKG